PLPPEDRALGGGHDLFRKAGDDRGRRDAPQRQQRRLDAPARPAVEVTGTPAAERVPVCRLPVTTHPYLWREVAQLCEEVLLPVRGMDSGDGHLEVQGR